MQDEITHTREHGEAMTALLQENSKLQALAMELEIERDEAIQARIKAVDKAILCVKERDLYRQAVITALEKIIQNEITEHERKWATMMLDKVREDG